MDRQQMNMRAIMARKKAKNFKSRQGGISDEAWKGISKKERKEMAEAGLTQTNRHAFLPTGTGEREDARKSNRNWERAAYEHGFGNVRDADELREVFQASKDIGISKMDSWNDARQFRRAHNDYDSKRFDKIEKQLDKQSSASKPETTAAPTPPKQEEPVTHSPQFAQANATVNNFDRSNIWGSESTGIKDPNPPTASTNNQGNFGESFMHRYKEGVKDNLQPTTPKAKAEEPRETKPSWQTW